MINNIIELELNEFPLVTGGQQSNQKSDQENATQQSSDRYFKLKVVLGSGMIIGIYTMIGLYA